MVVSLLLACLSGCAATVVGAGDNASSADAATAVDAKADAAVPTDLSSLDRSTVDRAPVRCLPPADGPLRTPPTGPDAVIAVAEDTTFGCVLRGDGRIRCRGQGLLRGVFGDGADDSAGMLRTVTLPIDDVRSFDISLHLGCAVRGDGALWCWGDNTSGGVHPDLPRVMLTPTRVPGIVGARRVSIALTLARTCVLLNGGAVVCWGGAEATPMALVDRGATDIAVANSHQCARFDDASARCAVASPSPSSELAIPTDGAEAIAASTFAVCAIDRSRAVTCWGARYPITDITAGPFDEGVRCATSLAPGFFHLCASTTDGAATCWGSNSFGQLGSPRTDTAPRPVPGVDRVVRVLRGAVSTCAVRDDGSLWCWGDGYLASDRSSQRNTLPHPIDW